MQDANRFRVDHTIRRLIGALSVAQEYLYRAQAVPVWTCADGRVMPITEMDDNHLRNAINLIERNAPHARKRAPILPALKAEQAARQARNAWSQARGPAVPLAGTLMCYDTDTVKPAVADFKCAPDPVAALARRVRDIEFKLQRRASHDALELMRTAIDKRLRALEMWTHKPVPVLTVDAFGRALRRVFDGYRREDWRAKLLKAIAESAGADVSLW